MKWGVLFIGLNIIDMLSTEIALSTGYFMEGNPFMDPLIGTPWFPITKIGGAALIVLWVHLRAEPLKANRILKYASGLYFFVCAWNIFWLAQI